PTIEETERRETFADEQLQNEEGLEEEEREEDEQGEMDQEEEHSEEENGEIVAEEPNEIQGDMVEKIYGLKWRKKRPHLQLRVKYASTGTQHWVYVHLLRGRDFFKAMDYLYEK